jgi:Cu/Zn superoxide dismutase
MRTIGRTMVLAVAVLGLWAGGALAKPGGVPAIPLNPEQETGDVTSDGSGFFTYTIEGDQLCYTLEIRNLTMAPFAAHIHFGPRNEAGPVVVPLAVANATSGTTSACITATESGPLTFAELAGIEANPRDYYVNVHTNNFPGGEIRGQLK